MFRPLLLVTLTALTLNTTCGGVMANPFGKLLAAKPQVNPLSMPAATMPNPERSIYPAGEYAYFPMRPDGMPYVLNVDETINMTDWLSHFYFNPRWRGEAWTPYPMYWIVERQCQLLSSWDEYEQENEFRVGNRWAKFFEKWSGYGP